MKKVFIAAAFILGAGMVHAQTAVTTKAATTTTKVATAAQMQRAMPSPSEIAKNQTDKMSTMLSLSEAQKKTMNQANLDFVTKMMAARQAKDRMAFEKALTERDVQYKKILTPEQYTKFSQMMPHRAVKPTIAPTKTMPAPVK